MLVTKFRLPRAAKQDSLAAVLADPQAQHVRLDFDGTSMVRLLFTEARLPTCHVFRDAQLLWPSIIILAGLQSGGFGLANSRL